jgi:TRAP-type transport system periplasmic protein
MAKLFVAVALALVTLVASAPANAADHTLRIATLAPKRSAWGKFFQAFQRAVDKKSGGKLELVVFYNGVAGAEDGMVAKMKSGQLDGASLTAVGLSRIYRDVLVLQLPGVLDEWALLDRARQELRPELEAGFAAQGFRVLGWGDVGLVRMMSKGPAVKRPEDLRGRKPMVWRNEPVGPVIFTNIGGVVPVPLSVMEVLPALRSAKIDVISAPALAAEQLQWVSQLDNVSSRASVCAVGASVMRQGALDALPADLREIFLDLQARAAAKSGDRIRKLDDESFGRLKKKMNLIELSDADREAWRAVLKRAVQQLAGGTFDKTLVERVVKLAGKS